MQYEDRITIATPEGVALELTLAGLGSRAIAGAYDLVVKGLAVVALFALLAGLFGANGFIVFVPAVALVLFAYDVLFEVLGGGRTLGKRWTGLRVVRASGRPIDARASVIRNILRLVDGPTLLYVPTMAAILVTRRNQRPGDLAADTIVVRERRGADKADAWLAAASRAIDPALAGGGSSWDVSAVPASDIATVRAFLERRNGLAADARKRLAAQLDGALRPRVGGADEPDPERFLEILYDAKRARG